MSKSLAPGLRLGWLVAPPDVVAEAAARKRTMDLGNPVTEQAVLAHFLTTGQYDRQLRRCQRLYRPRRDALVTALAEHLPGARVGGIAAGLHAIVTLPAVYGPQERFLARAAAAGIRLRPLSDYRAAPARDAATADAPTAPAPDEVALVVGYAHLSPEAISRAVRALGTCDGGRGAGARRGNPKAAKRFIR